MSEKIRVFQIIAGFALESPLGGIERFVIELVQALDRERFEPIVFGLWDWGTPYDSYWQAHLAQAGIHAFTGADWNENAPYTSFRKALTGLRAVFDERVDLIHSHSQFGDMAALALRRHLDAQQLVRTVHNEREWPKRPLRRLVLTNGVYPLTFDAELGVSQQVVKNLDRRPVARLLGRKAILAHNALNIQRFAGKREERVQMRRELGLPLDAPVAGSIGRLTQQKGYHSLIESFPFVLEREPDAHLLIVGGGELKESLEATARRLGIGARVHIPGPLTGIERVYAAMDIFVSSSLWEGLPTVVLEAMAANVPVVATAVSGNTELVRHEQTGLLVAPGDSEGLAAGICRLLAQPEEAMGYAQGARRLILPDFSMEQVARRHEALYTLMALAR